MNFYHYEREACKKKTFLIGKVGNDNIFIQLTTDTGQNSF